MARQRACRPLRRCTLLLLVDGALACRSVLDGRLGDANTARQPSLLGIAFMERRWNSRSGFVAAYLGEPPGNSIVRAYYFARGVESSILVAEYLAIADSS